MRVGEAIMSTVLAPDTDSINQAKAVASGLPEGELRLAGIDTPLPDGVAKLLREVLAALAAGQGVTVIAQDHEMTPSEAAAFLNVSRGYVLKLMDEGQLPFRSVGTHRRIPGMALAAHRARQDVVSRKAMEDLAALSEEMGLYDNPGPPPPKSDFRGKVRSG
jgi:excisionase family DNA binding protein